MPEIADAPVTLPRPAAARVPIAQSGDTCHCDPNCIQHIDAKTAEIWDKHKPYSKEYRQHIDSEIARLPILGDLPGEIAAVGWVGVGPDNMTGRIRCLAISPTSADTVYAGAAGGGVWKTTDGGLHWQPLMSQEQSLAIGALGIGGPAHPDVIYAATGEDCGFPNISEQGVGVYKSTNGGATWTLLSPIPSFRCSRVLVHPADPDVVYVAGNRGLHLSRDGGQTWHDITAPGQHVSDAVMDPRDPNSIYVGIWQQGVFRYVDQPGGQGSLATSPFSRGIPTGRLAGWIRLAAAVDPVTGTMTLVAKMGNGPKISRTNTVGLKLSGQIYQSQNDGKNWTELSDVNHSPNPLLIEPTMDGVFASMIAIAPDDPMMVYAGGRRLSISGDGGLNFAEQNLVVTVPGSGAAVEPTRPEHHAIVFSPTQPTVCYLATSGGVYRSQNRGSTWELRSGGLTASQLYDLATSQSKKVRLAATAQDGGELMSNGSQIWSNILEKEKRGGYEGGSIAIHPQSRDRLFIAPFDPAFIDYGHVLQRSTDGAKKFDRVMAVDPDKSKYPYVIEHVAVKPDSLNSVLITFEASVKRSVDGGSSFRTVLTTGKIVKGPAAAGETSFHGQHAHLVGSAPRRIAFSPSNPDYCYVATSDGSVYRSDDSGRNKSWKRMGAFQGNSGKTASSIAVSWTNPNVLYLAFNDWNSGPGYLHHIVRSLDGGATWSIATGVLPANRLPDIPVLSLAVDPDDSDVVFAGTQYGVFQTRDRGQSWGRFDADLPRVPVTAIVVHRSSRQLYAATFGRGAFQRTIP